jgi:transposase-like protein/IS1 family transposase
MTCLRCKHDGAKRFGTYGRLRIQRYRCNSCNSTFTQPRRRPLGRHSIELSKAVQVISLLTEGMSVRAISRLTEVHKTTILALLVTVGGKCRHVFDAHVRNVKPRFVQADEIWSFVHSKEAHLSTDDPKEWGDAYTWFALDSESKLILSYHVGKRDGVSALAFIGDLSERIAPMWRCQITTDGFKPYIGAIEEHFGANVDYAQLLKLYGRIEGTAPDWYSPTKVISTIPIAVSGNPQIDRISTSHVERANLSLRMHLRRFTRLTNAFSKKLDNLKAAVSLYMAFYNFVRVHQTLRITPAMQAGLTDHIWTIQELLEAA